MFKLIKRSRKPTAASNIKAKTEGTQTEMAETKETKGEKSQAQEAQAKETQTKQTKTTETQTKETQTEECILSTYQHIVVRGLPYDRGLAHGRQAKSKVQENVRYYRRPGTLAHSQELVKSIIQHVYRPALEKYFPSGYQEMKGIADSADVTLDDVILLNARYDLARPCDESTSAFFHNIATTTNSVLTAQNWNTSARLWEDDCIIYLEVHPDPSENKPSLFLVTEAGQLGCSGMSSFGISVVANALTCSDDYIPYPYHDAAGTYHDVAVRPLLPIAMLNRMLLECSHSAEAMACAANFPRHVSSCITVSTAAAFGVCLEITPGRIFKIYRQDTHDRYFIHTSHFTHPGFLARADVTCTYPGGSSWFRWDRFHLLVSRDVQYSKVSTVTLAKAFSDHVSIMKGICAHPDPQPIDPVIRHLPGYPFRTYTATVACVIYNLSRKEITVCKGPPCNGQFQTFKLTGL